MLHWNHVINPELIKGKGSWTPEEDRRILEVSGCMRIYIGTAKKSLPR